MMVFHDTPVDNLEDLRGQLTQRLGLLAAVAGGLLMWSTFTHWPLPLLLFSLALSLISLGLAARAAAAAHGLLARHLLVWGLTAGLLTAVWWFPNPLLPFLALLLVFIGEILLRGSGLAAGALVAGLAIWLVRSGYRDYALTELLVFLALAVALAWLIVHTLYTALQWTRTMQQRADQLLEEMRDRQGELRRTMKSLELANDLQRRTHRELVQARKQAEEARRMKEQFAANISHELRTPLNLILGFSELMHFSAEVYGEFTWPATLRRDVYQIYRSSRHLLEMIDDILDLSRFEISGFTLTREPTGLEALLQETMEIVQDLFRAHPACLEVDIEPGLPVLELDRTRMRQVLLNLFNNARRFTQAGTVRLAARRVGSEVWVSVSDSGPGIPADKLPHIFDEFYQVDYSLRRSHEGVGLGLAISKRFVQAHGGRIWVESGEGVGTTFTFALPSPDYPALRSLSPGEPLPEPDWPEPRPSVLLLSPDVSVAPLLRRHLEDYQVIWTGESRQVAELAALHHPRAIICAMPPVEQPGDGVELLFTLPVPVIECSLPGQELLARELSAWACLTKPITAEQLLQALAPLGDIRDILLIDDDRGFVQLVERILQAAGRSFTLRWAYDGQEGLLAMEERRPDLLLLDLMMPGVDGFQVIDRMQAEPELSQVPVILLTATSYEKDSLSPRQNRITICQPAGLRPVEILHCLQAVVEVLKPRYGELG